MAKSKAAKNREEIQNELKAFLGTTAGSVLVATAAGVALLPHAVKYLIKSAEDEGLPYVAMLPERVGNAIEEHAKKTRQAIEDAKEDEWHETNPDITTTDIDIELPGTQLETVTWIENMRLPPSADLLKKPFDADALRVYKNSGAWNYYGVYTINTHPYWLVIPSHVQLYRIFKYKKFHTPAPDHACTAKFNDGTWRDDPQCYEDVETKELVWPTRWPA